MALRWTAVVLLVAAAAWAHTHSHEGGGHHAHSHEPAHHKYSREANEAAAQEQAWEEEEELYHGHAHDHGHSHDDHGHSHEGGECPHAAAARKAAAQKQAEAQKQAHAGHGDRGHSHEGGECPHAAAAKKAAAQKQAEAQKQAHAGHSDHGHSHEGGECPHAAAAKKAAEQKKAASKALHAEGAGYTGALSFMNDARTRLWVHAIGATLLISFAPFVILFFIPITSNTEESGPLLKVLLAFGAGGLLGDAFLHLIPHATPAGEAGGHAHSHSHGHSHGEGGHGGHDMSVGGWVLAGIISFLIVEKLVRILRGEEAGHGHSHGHSHGGAAKAKQSDDEDDKKKKDKKEAKKQEQREIKQSGFKVAAYLNLVADFAHNFTDGLAIGASFLAGTTVGVVTMITVLVHEVPHEIGDFAILVQSGMSRKRAMMMQLVTAVGACAGCVLSLWSADGGALADAAASSWVLPFTAGGFIYIAAVSVIPELLDSSSSMWQSTKEIFFLLLGIFMMYLIAIYE